MDEWLEGWMNGWIIGLNYIKYGVYAWSTVQRKGQDYGWADGRMD